MIAGAIGISVCSIWLYFFGVNMNIVKEDCYYITE
jgi:hypothetical protein